MSGSGKISSMRQSSGSVLPRHISMAQSLTSFQTTTASVDVIGSILDDPANEHIFHVQPRSVRNMPMDCQVYTLLYAKQCFATHPSWTGKKPFDQWTHGLMHGEYGGGFVLNSTEEMERQFLYKYATDIHNGMTHYVIERRTPFFHFHADLDIKRKDPMDDDNMVALMKDFFECAQKFYPSTTAVSRFDMMVCTSIGKGKTGIHVNFPNLIVNQHQAIDIRNYYVSYLISKYGDMVGLQNSWEDIVDMCVYESNGLRMVGSNKTEDCPDCEGKRQKKTTDSPRRNLCTTCGGRGKIDSGKVYKPWMYIRNGQLHENWTVQVRRGLVYNIVDETTKRAVIELCSIRCPNVNESSSDFCISDEEMALMAAGKPRNKHSADDEKRPQSPRERIYKPVDTELGTYRMTEEDVKGMNKWKQKQFIASRSEQFQQMQEYIQSKNFPSPWRKVSIHNMFTNPKKTYYVVNVRGEGQRYCLNNRKGSHKSNNVYFYVERSSIVQRCYCSCQTIENRKTGKCESFSSEPIPITTKLERLLFPTVDAKVGHLHSERALSAIQDLDEYTLKLGTMIAKMDESRNDYLEERRQRLNHTQASREVEKTEEVMTDTAKKRRITKKSKPKPPK